MKKKNKMKTDLVEQYISTVIAHCAAKENKRDIMMDAKHCMDLEVLDNNIIRLGGKVDALKELLQKYYTNYEIGLFTDLAIYRHEADLRTVAMAITAAQVHNDLDDTDEVSEEDNDEDTSSIDSTSQALYGRRYEEVKRAEKEYEKAKQSDNVNDMQDAVKDNVD